jgi:hypothetical protein
MATLQMKIDRVHAEFVSGNAVSSTVTTHSVVARDGNGNVHANKFKSANMELAHVATERSNDTVFYSSVDDVIRKNTAAGMRGSLGLNNVNNTGATVAATADKIVLRDSEGGIFATGVTIADNPGTLFSYSDGTRSVYGGCDSNDPWFGTSSNHDLRLVTYGGERMRIDNTGNVGIGVTSPGYKLHVNGSIYGSGVTTPYLTGHGYIAERSYTFNPTSNTTKYFLGWTDQDSMQISIRDSGWGHGGTLYATVYFQWGNTPSIVIHKQSGDYTFYYTYKNDRMYLWFNNSGNSNNNNIIHSIRMRTTVGAISTTEPGSTETYASTTIGSSAATEFTTIRLCSTKDGNVGIGTTNPSYTLDVDGHINLSTGSTLKINGTDAVFSRWTASGSDIYRSSGNVGIGTTSPATDFHVGAEDANIRIGAINYSGSAANTTTYGLERSRNQILFSTWRDAQTDKIGAKICGINKQTYSSPAVRHLIQSTDLAFYTVPPGSASHDGTVERLRITDTGNVGIGTTSPSTALDVTGGYGYFRQGTMIGDYGSHGHTQHRTHIKDGSGSQTLYQVFLMRKNNNWTPGVIKLYWARTNVNGSGFDGYYTSWKYIRYSASGIQTGAMNGSTSQITLGYSTAGSAYDEIQITISGSERIIVDIEISDVYGFVM